MRRDHTLIVGSAFVLIVRTALDPGWWLPWVLFFSLACWIRTRPWYNAKLALAAIVIAWVAAAALLSPPALGLRTDNDRVPDPNAVLVCAGDSLTSGVDSNNDSQTYVARLRQDLGCTVVNAGFPGDTVGQLLLRLDRDVLAKRPTTVLVFIGGNDSLGATPRHQFAQELDAVVSRIKATGAGVVLVEVPCGIVWNSYAGVFRKTASRHGAVLVPETWLRWWLSIELLLHDRLADPLTLDGIHLSPAGATKIADWLKPYVTPYLP